MHDGTQSPSSPFTLTVLSPPEPFIHPPPEAPLLVPVPEPSPKSRLSLNPLCALGAGSTVLKEGR